MIRRLLRRTLRTIDALRPAPPAGTIVAICHCHHPELVAELRHALRHLPVTAPIHVTSSRADVFARWQGLGPAPSTRFHETENRGRDLKPFFEVTRRLDLAPDALVLKLHGKRSGYTAQGERWRRDLLDGLLRDRRAPGLASERFRADPRLGMLGPPGAYLSHPVYWGLDRDRVAALLSPRFGALPTEGELGFFAGSMLWIRAALLRALDPLVDLDAFEPEPLPQDGAYAHALERALPMAARRLGWHLGELGRSAPLDPEVLRARKIPYI